MQFRGTQALRIDACPPTGAGGGVATNQSHVCVSKRWFQGSEKKLSMTERPVYFSEDLYESVKTRESTYNYKPSKVTVLIRRRESFPLNFNRNN